VYDWLTVVKKDLSESLDAKLSYSQTIRWMIEQSATNVRDLIQKRRSTNQQVEIAKGTYPNTSFKEIIKYKEIAKNEDKALDKMRKEEINR